MFDTIGEWLWDAVKFVFEMLIGSLMDYLLRLLLQALTALLTYDPLSLEGDWWKSDYAELYRYGVRIAVIIGIAYAVVNLKRVQPGRAIRSVLYFGEVMLAGILIPIVYGFLLEMSGVAVEAARLGHTSDELFGNLDVFRGFGSITGAIAAAPLLVLTFLMGGIMLMFRLMASIAFVGSAFFYGTKEVRFGAKLWNRTVSFMLTTVISPPLMTLVITLGFLVQDDVDPNGLLTLFQPGAIVIIICLIIACIIPFWVSSALKEPIMVQVQRGKLNSSGKTTGIVKTKGQSSVIRDGLKMGGEALFDRSTMRYAARLTGTPQRPGNSATRTAVMRVASRNPHVRTVLTAQRVASKVTRAAKRPPPNQPPNQPPTNTP